MRLDHTGRPVTPYYDALCPACGSPLIQALEWFELGDDCWGVLIRCPECLGSHDLILDQDQMQDFRQAADEATSSLVQIAEYLEADVFRDNCDTFTRALRDDHIGPSDFR
jgi:hypothetical protein